MTVTIPRGTDGLRRFSFGVVLAAAALGAAAGPAAAAPAVQPVVSDQEALRAAQDALMGATVQSIELEMADGTPTWEVDVATRTGAEYEVQIDATTGMVVSVEESTD
ncbi:PepSY domain-containing protein [Nocardia otitidiscaviarum]|uniref:PepSY domain-containing protein n=1 Tax=Nocardia otitidiscaviarum TaxID=1823 RepID=UPI0004A6D86B|nr:PepSY domain-containing protein [Nocardia otitidiscaviarum]MBF6137404.1 PepSY domain-containing protein [Nocardia otitidiscaviarum]MBF6488334.1 PepSY domain-containing protein [Nocardia otitidiscaviarum]